MTHPDVLKSQFTTGLDKFAIFLSGLCLLHCLAIPFALLLGPLFSGWLSENETTTHWVLLAAAVPISVLALWRGYRQHQDVPTIIYGAFGLVLMFIGVAHFFGETYEIWLTAVGVISLLIAHVRNLKHRHDHQHEH